MGKKKPFIGRDEGQKFSVMSRSQKDPLIANTDVGEHVLVAIKKKKELSRFGIYAEDDYDYLQHLKDRNEITENVVECSLIKVPESNIKLPSTVFETKGAELKIGLFNQAAPNSSLDLNVDPDVAANLDGELDDVEELEDDFMQLANGGDGPICVDEQISVFRDEKSGKKDILARFGLVRENFSDEDSDDDFDDEMDFDNFDEEERPKPKGKRAQLVEKMTTGSISSSVMPRNEGKRTMDACFDQILEDYDDEKIGYGQDESDEGEGEDNEQDPELYKQQLVQLRGHNVIQLDELEKMPKDVIAKTLKADEMLELQPEVREKITVEESRKRSRWDCESVLSNYSTLYNHPTVIREPSKKKFGLTKKDLNALDKMEIDQVSVISGTSVSTFRPKGESAEERKARKIAVKEQQRERRQEKKSNKLAFMEEKRKMDAQSARQLVKGRLIK